MTRTKDTQTDGETSFQREWEGYWEEMAESNRNLKEQQSVTRTTLDLTFDI